MGFASENPIPLQYDELVIFHLTGDFINENFPIKTTFRYPLPPRRSPIWTEGRALGSASRKPACKIHGLEAKSEAMKRGGEGGGEE
jgi:hypothetical protein